MMQGDDHDDVRDDDVGDCLSLRLGLYYRHHLNARRLQRRTDELRQLLQVSREREQAQRQEQQDRMEDTENAGTLQRQADNLLCQQNPDRESIERAQKLYQRARRLRRAIPVIEERLRHHDQRLALLDGSESFLEDLIQAEWDDPAERSRQLEDLKRELEELLTPKRQRRQQVHRQDSHSHWL